MRKILFSALLIFSGCDKLSPKPNLGPGAKPADAAEAAAKKAQEKLAADPEYAKGYESAKARAVSEFPALGVAGSPFNVAFVTQANRMKDTHAQELSAPDWPYKLALRVNTEQTKARADLYKPGTVLSVADLSTLKPIPAGACVSGHITQAYGGRMADITLDNALRCEISDPAASSGSSEVIWVREGNLLVLKARFGNTPQFNVIKSYAIGQRISCEGVFTPPGTTKKLVGVMKP